MKVIIKRILNIIFKILNINLGINNTSNKLYNCIVSNSEDYFEFERFRMHNTEEVHVFRLVQKTEYKSIIIDNIINECIAVAKLTQKVMNYQF